MSAYYTHTLEINREEFITYAPGKSLSLVDPDNYQTFVGKDADALDMMVHLQDQMNALTAVSWEVPERPLNVRIVVTGNHRAMERITFNNRPPVASGTVRSYGKLCLLGDERLMDCARHSKHSLLKGERLPKDGRPHMFNVPSGIFYALIYYRFPYPDGFHAGHVTGAETRYDYTVFLHHYPHPAPRIAPVRLSGGFIPWAGRDDLTLGQLYRDSRELAEVENHRWYENAQQERKAS
jgi:hypothetical protein